jgi:uncharacterized protein YjeT (DUF2065 family)
MKIGRNDPCPCGSGKKYKHCCLAAEANVTESPLDLRWRRMRQAIDGLPTRMLRFVGDEYGPTALSEAWDSFTLWEEEPFEPDSPHTQVFMPWFFHFWTPDPHDTEVRDEALHDLTPTEAYLLRKGRSLDPLLRAYLEACDAAAFSFHEILRCDPGRGMRLRDIMTGEEREVAEASGSSTLQRGDIVFGLVADTEALALLEGISAFAIPPACKASIVQLRARISAHRNPITADLLREFMSEILEVYHKLFDQAFNPKLPRLQNTDGDPLVLQKLVFDIDSPQQAFDALKHLALDASEESLLADATRDSKGTLVSVGFPWLKRGNQRHAEWDNTVLGTIEIKANRLTVEVNSERRAEALRSIVRESLGERARYRATRTQSLEKLLAKAPEAPEEPPDRALSQLPEVKAKLTEMLRLHYEHWVNEKLPVLGGRTPLEAVNDRDGREIVESLILQAERDAEKANSPVDESILRQLRERLGLAS